MCRLYPNSFLIDARHSHEVPQFQLASKRVPKGHVDLFIEASNNRYLQSAFSDDGFAVYFGDRLHCEPNYLKEFSDLRWNSSVDNGCLIKYDKHTCRLSMFSDFLGTEIAYYLRLANRTIVSNRLDNFRLVTNVRPDFVGIYQFLLGANTVGGRTIIKDGHKTRPLTLVVIDVETGSIEETTGGRWSRRSNGGASLPTIAEGWRRKLVNSPRSVLMLSGGWDSRLLLAENPERLDGSYTHGDLDSREVRLAFEIGRQKLSEMTFRGLDSSKYGVDTVSEMCTQLGHAFFPHWYGAAKTLAQSYDSPLTSGLFVEHFSGHYGFNSVGPGRVRIFNTIKTILFPETYENIAADAACLKSVSLLSSSLRNPWFLPNDWVDAFGDVDDVNVNDIRTAFVGYQSEGTVGIHEAFERFRLEHSGRQYFANQTKCGIPFNGYFHPYADSQLSQEVVSIPYKDRVAYKLSRNVLFHLDQDLLQEPMAATLVKAKRPIVLQEASRGLRIIMERAIKSTRGVQALHLGWNNFQFLHSTNVFYEYVSSLRASIWARDSMNRYIAHHATRNGDAYSMLDMFGKILTIDHVLFGAGPDNFGVA